MQPKLILLAALFFASQPLWAQEAAAPKAAPTKAVAPKVVPAAKPAPPKAEDSATQDQEEPSSPWNLNAILRWGIEAGVNDKESDTWELALSYDIDRMIPYSFLEFAYQLPVTQKIVGESAGATYIAYNKRQITSLFYGIHGDTGIKNSRFLLKLGASYSKKTVDAKLQDSSLGSATVNGNQSKMLASLGFSVFIPIHEYTPLELGGTQYGSEASYFYVGYHYAF